ncbi:HEXXH motif domain-containing protein [Micromonospora sp. NPDC048930]|uniref:HEXXH motif domain-containing protein n=1 Tax=Micromonospora sp. NPDC048930 TaxID=3364261 RepID=UPI00371AA055
MTAAGPARAHRLSEGMLRALASGGGGPEAVRALAAIRHSRDRLLTTALVELAHRSGHPQAAAASQAYRVLAEIEHVVPEAVRRVLSYPTVGAWLAGTVRALLRPTAGPVAPSALGQVTAAAAVRAGVTTRVPAAGPLVVLPSLGQAWLPGDEDAFEVRAEPDGPVLCRGSHRVVLTRSGDRSDGPDRAERPARTGLAAGPAGAVDASGAVGATSAGWTPLHRIVTGAGPLRLAVTLDGPGWRLAPGDGPDPRLLATVGPAEHRRWRRRTEAGWSLLSRHHQAVAGEVAAAVRVLAPLRRAPDGLVSGTFRDAFGAVAMSLPPDATALAVTLAHEVQHAKMVGLMSAFQLVEPGPDERFYAPWREDPRPLGALLHGTYAHLGVAAFWQRQRRVEEHAESAFAAHVAFARWRVAAWEATDALARTGRLTAEGEVVLDGMRATLREFLAEPVPAAARRRADGLAAGHRRRSGAAG